MLSDLHKRRSALRTNSSLPSPCFQVEIEEKVDADYTGLKIQSLRLEEREAAAREENGGGEDDDASKNGGAGNDGPWKKIEVAPVIEKDTTEVVSESKEVG